MDDETIIETLSPLVMFTRDGGLVTRDGFSGLTTPQRIVALVLGRWAAYQNGSTDNPVLDEGTIREYITVSPETVRVYVAEDAQFLNRQDGRYVIPYKELHRAVGFLKNSGP